MSSVLEYMTWRGDITFQVDRLNEVDNLIFSMLSYLNFGAPKNGISIKELSKKYFASRGMDDSKLQKEKSYSDMIVMVENLLRKAAKSDRFKDIILTEYISKYDEINQSQFCAMCFVIDEDNIFVAFRGTDDTILGFKEDFNMSFSTPVFGQIESAKYLKRIIESNSHKNIYVGGHSKGGNFAVYSVVGLPEKDRERIRRIFNNDGPGFSKEMIESDAYRDTVKKVSKILPVDSVVGILMYDNEQYSVVEAIGNNGFIQHNGMNWKVVGKSFVRAKKLSDESNRIDITLKTWLENLSHEERVIFVDEFYEIIKNSTNAVRTGDITNKKLKSAIKIIKEMSSLEPERREQLSSIFSLFLKTDFEMRTKKKKSILVKNKGRKIRFDRK